MAGRPRFLDALDPARRAIIEPELLKKIGAGETLDPLHAWLSAERVAVGRSTLASYMREQKGPAAEQPERRLRREVRAAAAAPVEDRPGAAPPPSKIADDPAAEEPDDADHGAALRRQLRAARQLARAAESTKDQLAARRLEADLQEQLRAYEREQRDPAQGPRIVFYFPERTELRHLEAEES